MSSKISDSDKKWIESEYPKFFDKILRKSMTLAVGDYFGIYCNNKSGKIDFTKHFITNKTGDKLKNELEKNIEEFTKQLGRKDNTIFYIIKSPSIDIFVTGKDILQEKFKEKVQQAFYNYMDIKDQKYEEMNNRNEFY
jgi:hypothetical protein